MRILASTEFSNTVLHYLGFVLLIIGGALLLPLIPAIAYHDATVLSFVLASLISFAWGILLFKKFEAGKITLGRAMVLGAAAFVFMSVVGGIPYYFHRTLLFNTSGLHALVNALFESTSGFTTTGLSVIRNVEAVPASLLFWRSMTQWIGGIGVIVLFLTVMVGPGMSASYLFRGEAREERLAPSIKHTVRGMATIYGFYTVAGAVLLYWVGMPALDAVNHVMTTVSTGGFSTKAASIAAYSSPAIEVAITFLMILGATSFVLHYRLLGWKWEKLKGFTKSTEFRALLFIGTLGTILLALYLRNGSLLGSTRVSVFQVFSALTTTGYATMDLAAQTDFFKGALITLMFIGGSAGSTAGGLKIIRLLILMQSLPWLIRKFLLPKHAISPLKIGKKVFSVEEVNQVSWFFFIYIVFLVGGALILTAYNYPFLDALFEVVSAGATVGLSVGVTHATAPLGVQAVLIFEMLLGRLEILPILVWIGATIGAGRWSRFYE